MEFALLKLSVSALICLISLTACGFAEERPYKATEEQALEYARLKFAERCIKHKMTDCSDYKITNLERHEDHWTLDFLSDVTGGVVLMRVTERGGYPTFEGHDKGSTEKITELQALDIAKKEIPYACMRYKVECKGYEVQSVEFKDKYWFVTFKHEKTGQELIIAVSIYGYPSVRGQEENQVYFGSARFRKVDE